MPYRKAVIRPFRREDEAFLFARVRMALGGLPGWDDRRTIAALEREAVFVAEVEREPAGFVALASEPGAVRVDRLFVIPEHEHEGVGRQLVAWAEGYAISVGARTLRVAVEEDNRRARDFYRRFGFVPVADELLELTLPQR